MKCPTCNINLVISERKGIEIDYCPDCRGIWLDRGELDKIIERSLDEMPPANFDGKYSSSKNYDDKRGYDDDYYKNRRKKSFLGEIFDF